MNEEIEKLKLIGNKLFSESKFNEAINCFTKAIELSEKLKEDYQRNKIAILYSNRSNCFLNLNMNQEALLDAEKSINLNNMWFKGYFRKAKAVFALGNITEAEKSLNKALEFASTVEEKKEIVQTFEIFESHKKKDFWNAFSSDNEKKHDRNAYMDYENNIFDEVSDNSDEDPVQDQVDFLMSQFIKPYEDDAFRSLGVYHGVQDGDLDKKGAKMWIKFGEQYGHGDSPQLMDALLKFVVITDKKQLQKECEKIYEICGILD